MKTQTEIRIDETAVRKILHTVDQGLCAGLGESKPGHMCVEAAVCYALGLPHGDDPACVGAAVRAFKIALNDAEWSSAAARAAGMRRLAIAQLGSDSLDQTNFVAALAIATVNQVVPIGLRAAAARLPGHAAALESAAAACEKVASLSAAESAARSAESAARSARSAAESAESAAWSAESAARSARSAAESAESAESAARSAEWSAMSAAWSAESAWSAEARDKALSIAADTALAILVEMGAPGCAYLHLADA